MAFIYKQTINAAQRMLQIAKQYVPGMRNHGGDADESAV